MLHTLALNDAAARQLRYRIPRPNPHLLHKQKNKVFVKLYKITDHSLSSKLANIPASYSKQEKNYVDTTSDQSRTLGNLNSQRNENIYVCISANARYLKNYFLLDVPAMSQFPVKIKNNIKITVHNFGNVFGRPLEDVSVAGGTTVLLWYR